MPNDWFIRIDGSFHDVSGMLIHFTKKCDKAIFYEHPATEGGNGIHVHGLYETATFAKQSFYDAAKKIQFLNTNKKVNYSVLQRKKSVEEIIQYMTKGYIEPKWVLAYDAKYIEQQKKNGYDAKEKKKAPPIAEGDVGATKKERVTMYQLENEIVCEYAQEHLDYETVGIIYQDLHKITLKVTQRYKKGRNDRFITNLMEGASCEINDTEQWSRIKKHFHTH